MTYPVLRDEPAEFAVGDRARIDPESADGLQVAHNLNQFVRSRVQDYDQAEAAVGEASGQPVPESVRIHPVLLVTGLRCGEQFVQIGP